MKQNELANITETSESMISLILTGARRPSWDLAKKFAEITDTGPELWMDGSAEQKRAALKKAGNGK